MRFTFRSPACIFQALVPSHIQLFAFIYAMQKVHFYSQRKLFLWCKKTVRHVSGFFKVPKDWYYSFGTALIIFFQKWMIYEYFFSKMNDLNNSKQNKILILLGKTSVTFMLFLLLWAHSFPLYKSEWNEISIESRSWKVHFRIDLSNLSKFFPTYFRFHATVMHNIICNSSFLQYLV